MTAQAPVQFDRSHIASFTESAMRIETVYFVLDPDYKLYMDIQQTINLEILTRFNAEKLKFAFPSRTVYHEGPNAKDLAVGTQPQTAADAEFILSEAKDLRYAPRRSPLRSGQPQSSALIQPPSTAIDCPVM